MDDQFVQLVGGKEVVDGDGELRIEFIDDMSDEVKIVTSAGSHTHRLKPMPELYGIGVGAATVDPTNDAYMPLFLTIEESIIRHYRSEPSLTDGNILLALEHLGMSPEADPGGDLLIRHLQMDLRVTLSLEDYSRQEVRAALRKVAKSVSRHTRAEGPKGYITFIVKALNG